MIKLSRDQKNIAKLLLAERGFRESITKIKEFSCELLETKCNDSLYHEFLLYFCVLAVSCLREGQGLEDSKLDLNKNNNQ